jgi:hypothetical protein
MGMIFKVLHFDAGGAKDLSGARVFPEGGYMTSVEHWRQLTDGQIELCHAELLTH